MSVQPPTSNELVAMLRENARQAGALVEKHPITETTPQPPPAPQPQPPAPTGQGGQS